MELIENFFIHSYLGALLWIALGLWSIHDSINKDPKVITSTSRYITGWAGGIGFVLIGVFIIIGKLMGKL